MIRIVVYLIFTFICCSAAKAQSTEINLLTSEYPPFQSHKLKNKGALSEIIINAYALSGIKVNIILAPWNKALEQAKTGKYDGLFPAWHTKEREQYFVFSDPFVPNQMGFYVHKDMDIQFSRFTDLKRYTIGIVNGYAYPESFFNAQLRTIGVTKDEQNMALLCRGLIDLALTDKTVGMYIVKTRYSECAKKIRWLTAINTQPNHLVISNKIANHKQLLAAFNRGLAQLQKQGGVRKILEKHGLTEAHLLRSPN